MCHSFAAEFLCPKRMDLRFQRQLRSKPAAMWVSLFFFLFLASKFLSLFLFCCFLLTNHKKIIILANHSPNFHFVSHGHHLFRFALLHHHP